MVLFGDQQWGRGSGRGGLLSKGWLSLMESPWAGGFIGGEGLHAATVQSALTVFLKLTMQ